MSGRPPGGASGGASGAARRAPSMVARRLALGLLPALLAVALVAGLAYWGEYGRTAPAVVVVGAGALTLASLALTWWNARDLGRRVAHLSATVARVHRLVDAATTPGSSDGASAVAAPDASSPAEGTAWEFRDRARDELARIEQVLGRLAAALATAREERRRAEAAVETSRRAQAVLVERSAAEARERLDELRLPLHILLESRFGALNENQEELLAAARTAGDAMETVLRRLARVAAADGGTLAVQRTLVAPNDVVRAVEAQARALAAAHDVRLEVTLEPALARAWADRAKLAEALVLLLAEAARQSGAGGRLHLRTWREPGVAVIALDRSGDAAVEGEPDADVLLARRLLAAQGADVEALSAGLRVRLLAAGM